MEDNDWFMLKRSFIHMEMSLPIAGVLELDLTRLFLPKPFYYSAVLVNLS